MLFAPGGSVRRAVSIAIVLVFVGASVLPIFSSSPDDPNVTAIDAIFSPLVQANDPGVAVLVKKDATVIFEKGYGTRDQQSRLKIDPQTNFRLASVTKQFTAMAIMLLVHDGKLHYEDHITNIFPDFPAYGKNITIRNLLNHMSGLPDYEEIMEQQEKAGGPKYSANHQIQDEQVLTLLEAQTKGRFLPGTRWEYSNSGYVVLGLIVAKASGIPYRDFLKQRIFAPLKMNHTVVFQNGKNSVSRRAYGYSKENNKLVQTDQSSTSATLGDGGIYSNVEDLAKWDEGLRNHTLLSEKEMEPAFTPGKLNDGSLPYWPKDPHDTNKSDQAYPILYGFGWFLDPYHGHTRIYHDGESMGFRTTIQRFVDNHFTVIVLSNRTDLNPNEISLKAADLLLQPSTH
jgi:CubicO group peptidase (beta-lactamase class C family)